MRAWAVECIILEISVRNVRDWSDSPLSTPEFIRRLRRTPQFAEAQGQPHRSALTRDSRVAISASSLIFKSQNLNGFMEKMPPVQRLGLSGFRNVGLSRRLSFPKDRPTCCEIFPYAYIVTS